MKEKDKRRSLLVMNRTVKEAREKEKRARLFLRRFFIALIIVSLAGPLLIILVKLAA